jgi:ornithine cyclodeaminase
VQGRLVAEAAIRELGAVIENPKLGRVDDQQITVADLTGVAIQDIQIATMVNRAFLGRQAR